MLFMVVERFRNRDAKGSIAVAWGDLIEFEIVPVVPSTETRETIERFL
jgi:uncharacterized protein DUF3303